MNDDDQFNKINSKLNAIILFMGIYFIIICLGINSLRH